jgi:hypothetical protein
MTRLYDIGSHCNLVEVVCAVKDTTKMSYRIEGAVQRVGDHCRLLLADSERLEKVSKEMIVKGTEETISLGRPGGVSQAIRGIGRFREWSRQPPFMMPAARQERSLPRRGRSGNPSRGPRAHAKDGGPEDRLPLLAR